MSPIEVSIIFSGLILLASDSAPRGTHKALLVDDGRRHTAAIYVVEGDCKECIPVLQPYPLKLIWELEGGDPSDIYLRWADGERLPTSSLRKVGRTNDVQGPVAHPVAQDDTADLEWLPSLSKLVSGSRLETRCWSGNLARCGSPMAARVTIPFGELRTCHLAHGQGNKVAEVGFNGPASADKAHGNAFLSSLSIVPPEGHQASEQLIEICRARGREPDCRWLKSSAASKIVLYVVNESGNLWVQGEHEHAAQAGEHEHFSQYYPALRWITSPAGRPLPYLEILSQSMTVSPGLCESFFAQNDALAEAVLQTHPQNTTTTSSADLPSAVATFLKTMNFPHSASECDTTTYP